VSTNTYTLEHLLSPNIIKARVEILDTASNVLELVLVGALKLAGLADGEVEVQADATVGVVDAEPSVAAGRGAGGEAELVFARVGGGEGEAAGFGAALGDDAVVIVEDFLVLCKSLKA